MKAVFTAAFWRKLDNFDRILISATAALLAIPAVYLAPAAWNAIANAAWPEVHDLVSLRELLIVALRSWLETPQRILEALCIGTLLLMMLHQLLQAVASATIRVKQASGLDTSCLEKRVRRWGMVSVFALLLVPGAVISGLFWAHGVDRAWAPANPALTNWDILFGVFLSVFAQLGIVVLTGKIAEAGGGRPSTPIREFAAMKFVITALLVIATGFALDVVAVWVSMVVFDLILGPLDDPARKTDAPTAMTSNKV